MNIYMNYFKTVSPNSEVSNIIMTSFKDIATPSSSTNTRGIPAGYETELRETHTIYCDFEFKKPELTPGFPPLETELSELGPLETRDGAWSELANDRRIDDYFHNLEMSRFKCFTLPRNRITYVNNYNKMRDVCNKTLAAMDRNGGKDFL